MGPVARLEAHPRCLASQTPLETRERNATPMPSDKTGYRHGESLQKRSNKSKIQAPTSNIQRRSKIQCQIGAAHLASAWFLMLGYWIFSGSWILDLHALWTLEVGCWMLVQQ